MVLQRPRWCSDTRTRRRAHRCTGRRRRPASTYLVSLAVAPLAQARATRGAAFRSTTTSITKTARWPGRSSGSRPDMIDVYTRLTGVEYPWAKYAQTTVADFFGGMENVSATTLVDWLPDARAYRDRPWYQHRSSRTSWPTSGSATSSPTENWANIGSTRDSPSSCRGSTGARSWAARRAGLLPGRVPRSS